MTSSDEAFGQARERRPEQVMLRGVTVRQVARVIHGLNSHLVSIAAQHAGDTMFLIYTFDVAGVQQAFQVPVTGIALESIADLYPEAAAYEQFWINQRGLRFLAGGEQ